MINQKQYRIILGVCLMFLIISIAVPLFFKGEDIGSLIDWLIAYGTVGAVFISLWLSKPTTEIENIILSDYRKNCELLAKLTASFEYSVEKKSTEDLSFSFINEQNQALYVTDIELFMYYIAPNNKKIYTMSSLYENTYENGYPLFWKDTAVDFPFKIPRKALLQFFFSADHFQKDLREIMEINHDQSKRHISTLYLLVKIFDEKNHCTEKVIAEYYFN